MIGAERRIDKPFGFSRAFPRENVDNRYGDFPLPINMNAIDCTVEAGW
jgi:hypothetical protein